MNKNLFQIEDVFFIDGKGTIAVGKLVSGTVNSGMKSNINGKQSEILEIESQNKILKSLESGIQAGLLLSNIETSDISKGSAYSFE